MRNCCGWRSRTSCMTRRFSPRRRAACWPIRRPPRSPPTSPANGSTLRELKSARPETRDFNDNLRQSFRRETELFFESIMREDRNVVDLLNADYTFVDERLAEHYGIPDVYGSRFRRVKLPDDSRRGLLGQGSILLVTSVATRTSPVARGKWVLENILGTSPPLPPPNVPALPEDASAAKVVSVREKMEAHRKNPVCASCHKIMDPIGFSLENFDLTGKWRIDRRRRANRFLQSDGGWNEAVRTCQLARGFVEPLGRFCFHADRKADDLRCRSRIEVLRHARGARHHPRRWPQRRSFLVHRARNREERALSDENETAGKCGQSAQTAVVA